MNNKSENSCLLELQNRFLKNLLESRSQNLIAGIHINRLKELFAEITDLHHQQLSTVEEIKARVWDWQIED